MSDLRCSIVIPTRGRAESLERLLRSLACQTADPESFETIVVVDGPDEQSTLLLEDWERDCRLSHLRYVVQQHSGPAAARNRGVDQARGPVVLFLDDDVEPDRNLVQTHQAHHLTGERIAVLGDYRIPRPVPPSMYRLQAWMWWEDKFETRGRASARRYTDFVTGNVSVRRDDFLAVGGFDADFRGYGLEDYELGWRLLHSGVRFLVDRAASAVHHHSPSLRTSLMRHRDEGMAEVILGSKHPQLRPGLRLMTFPQGRLGWMCRLAFSAPSVGDAVARGGLGGLRLSDALSRRRTWARIYDSLRTYWFWRGVAAATGSFAVLLDFQSSAPLPPVVHIDIDGAVPDPDELLPPTIRGVPVDVTVWSSGTALTTVTLPSDIGSHRTARDELIDMLARNPIIRLWLANTPELEKCA
jgi:GT2 family glycosyltransferase